MSTTSINSDHAVSGGVELGYGGMTMPGCLPKRSAVFVEPQVTYQYHVTEQLRLLTAGGVYFEKGLPQDGSEIMAACPEVTQDWTGQSFDLDSWGPRLYAGMSYGRPNDQMHAAYEAGVMLGVVGRPKEKKPTDQILPFTTDGCSSFPDDGWRYCCVEHDKAYWAGGPREDRKKADAELKECVAASGHPGIGKLMYPGVRVGGIPWSNRPYRWGYGWPYGINYDSLNPEQKAAVLQGLEAYEQLELHCENSDLTMAQKKVCNDVDEMKQLLKSP